MHIFIISSHSLDDLSKKVNEEIHRLHSIPAKDRNYTMIKDVKIISDENGYHATLIYDDAM